MASIFTKILAGEIPGCFAFQDEHWVGLLDLFPVSPGHVLLVPRVEVARFAELPAEVLASYGAILARASAMVYRALGCDALSILVRDGSAAGQEVPHVHVHLIPRNTGDAAHDFHGGRYGDDDETARSAMAAMAERLATAWDATG